MTIGKKSTPTLDDMVREAHQRLGVGEKKPKRDNPEQRLQSALVAQVRVWDRNAGPLVTRKVRGRQVTAPEGAWMPGPLSLRFPELMDLYATPNGGARDEVTAGKLKGEGVLRGVPDLHLPVPIWTTMPPHPGLYLETKVPGSYPSKEQRALMARLVARGYAVAVWRTLEEGLDMLERYATGRWEQKEELLK